MPEAHNEFSGNIGGSLHVHLLPVLEQAKERQQLNVPHARPSYKRLSLR